MAFLQDNSFFNIYFGDASDAIYPSMYLGKQLTQNAIEQMPAPSRLFALTNIEQAPSSSLLVAGSIELIKIDSNKIGSDRCVVNHVANRDDERIATNVDVASILVSEPFVRLKQMLQTEKLYFLHQIHSAQGYCAMPALCEVAPPFTQQGDFLITNNRAFGIGIMTADCLPVIVYDAAHNAVGIAHAGWRGSVQNIVPTMIRHMQREYGTAIDQLHIFFGPSARACCYEITQDFLQNISMYSFFERTIRISGNKLFFDLSLFNYLQLEEIGVNPAQIGVQYNQCTMCDSRFFSHRRDGAQAGRNMTVVSLK